MFSPRAENLLIPGRLDAALRSWVIRSATVSARLVGVAPVDEGADPPWLVRGGPVVAGAAVVADAAVARLVVGGLRPGGRDWAVPSCAPPATVWSVRA